MNQDMLIPVGELHRNLGDDAVLPVDCRFVLDKPHAGFEAYCEGHIPGAAYANLDLDLSRPVTSDSGRHPLPDAENFAAFLARIGWRPGRQMLVYDDGPGAIAARLWWLMKYFGHGGAAMLDGGFAAWKAAGYDLEKGAPEPKPAPLFPCKARPELVLTTDAVSSCLEDGSILLVDARAPERFRGEVEPIDRVAGHIPGSINYPFNLNLSPDNLFKPAPELHAGLSVLTDEATARDIVHLCGSGVTACHNIFAAEMAGLGEQKLYVGSWSEWIQDPGRPIAK
jgi:thiosulfate/3-mercaptopyruvate sulfurtransferase